MGVRTAAASLLAVASLASCSTASNGTGSVTSALNSSSGAGPGAASGGGPAGTGICAKLVRAQAALQGLAPQFADPTALRQDLAQEAALLTQLKQAAPAELASAMDDLISLVKAAEQTLVDPAHPDVAALQALASRVPADAAKIQAYVTANCPVAAPSS